MWRATADIEDIGREDQQRMLLSINSWSHLEETIMPDSGWHQPMTVVDSDIKWTQVHQTLGQSAEGDVRKPLIEGATEQPFLWLSQMPKPEVLRHLQLPVALLLPCYRIIES